MDKFIVLVAITVVVCGGILIHGYYNDKKREWLRRPSGVLFVLQILVWHSYEFIIFNILKKYKNKGEQDYE